MNLRRIKDAETDREWVWRPDYARHKLFICVGLAMFIVRYQGKPIEKIVAGWWVGIQLNPLSWKIGSDHDWYDGPNCSWWLGPLSFVRSGQSCATCAAS